MREPDESFVDFRIAVDRARWLTAESAPDDRVDLEGDMCLASRTAYFDLMCKTVVNRVIDPITAEPLIRLFLEAKDLMHDGQYKRALAARLDDLASLCHKYRRSAATVIPLYVDPPSWEAA